MSTHTGRLAEASAAEYLERHGFTVIAKNWRRRDCEIDIVACSKSRMFSRQQKIVYFVEVKYRKTNNEGEGLDYITPNKLRSMRYGAEVWMHENQWTGDARLMAVAVSGSHYDVDDVIEVD